MPVVMLEFCKSYVVLCQCVLQFGEEAGEAGAPSGILLRQDRTSLRLRYCFLSSSINRVQTLSTVNIHSTTQLFLTIQRLSSMSNADQITRADSPLLGLGPNPIRFSGLVICVHSVSFFFM